MNRPDDEFLNKQGITSYEVSNYQLAVLLCKILKKLEQK